MKISKLLLILSIVCFSCTPLLAQNKKKSAAPPPTASDPAEKLRGLDDLAAKAMDEWKVPGVAIAVVKDGKVIYAKGYGYRDL